MKFPYTKTSLTFSQQIQLLRDRGLTIDDEKRSLHYLEHINYYRLSAYMVPFQLDKVNHIFHPGTNFQDVLNLYNFDRELRLLLYDAIERIEISVRTNFTYVMSHKYNPFWISNEKLFSNKELYKKNFERLEQEINRSKEIFLSSFHSKYSDRIPPAWITTELISFSLLSIFYKNLGVIKDQKEIANRFGLNRIIFESWLHTLLYIRNLCAHHCRIWNRELPIKPVLPHREITPWLITEEPIRNDRIFIVILILLYFLSSINPHHHFVVNLIKLFEKFPMVDLAPMGFPRNWKDEPLFQIQNP